MSYASAPSDPPHGEVGRDCGKFWSAGPLQWSGCAEGSAVSVEERNHLWGVRSSHKGLPRGAGIKPGPLHQYPSHTDLGVSEPCLLPPRLVVHLGRGFPMGSRARGFSAGSLREARNAADSHCTVGGSERVQQKASFLVHQHNRWESEHMGGSFEAEQWKPEESGGNRVVSQREIATVGPVHLHLLEPHVVAACSITGALNECLRHDGREDQEIAQDIHISRGYMSKLLRSVWAAQIKRLIAFMRATRCVAPLQKMADELGFELRAKRTALEQRVAEAEALAKRLAAELAQQSDGRAAA